MSTSSFIYLLLILNCGKSIADNGTPADLSLCSTTCKGNDIECCDGADQLNVFNTRAVPAGWTLLGCYVDSVGARTLPSQLFPPGNLTADSCTAACLGARYIYAGTEYGGECYCGNSLANGGGLAPDGDAGCNVPCKGDDQQACGGSNRLSMYQYTSGASSSSSLATGTTSRTSQSQTQSNLSPPSSSLAVAPAATGLPKGWKYQGCWVDNANGRIMNNQQPDDSSMTVESCISQCVSLGYKAAGMQYSSQCFCDNYLSRGAVNTSDSDCSMPCGGNPNEKCGAGNRDSVYSTDVGPITVNPVPVPQTSNLTGSFKYAGCYHDDNQNHALPYFIHLINNNTANNCIKQCSDFGYNAGGLEYGEECYCGDMDDIAAAGVKPAPETDCSNTCSGNVTGICGGGSRLSLYTWGGPPFHTWNYASGDAAGAYKFLIGGVVVPLVTQAARNGKVTFLEKGGTGVPNATGAYELDLAQLDNFTAAWRPMHVKTDIFCSASITLPDKVGRQLNIGGWSLDSTFGVRLYWPDGSPGVWGKNDWQEDVKTLSLQNGRWYPAAMVMANGSALVVGGESGSNAPAVPTLELLPKAGPVLYCDWLNRTDPNNLYPFLAVLPSGGIFVQYYNEAIILDEGTLQIKRQLPNAPGAVNNFKAGRTYPLEGSAVLLPQHAPYTDPLTILICGGSTPYQGFALDNCVSIAPDVPDAKWTLERMPSRRVLSNIVALPDGKYLILNGAHQGVAGFGLANDPNLNAILYDPTKPVNSRMTVMANTTVPRLYHSEAILLDDGRVLVSGSDPLSAPRYEEEYRVEVFIPPYLMGSPVKPKVSFATDQLDWTYGGAYSFTSASTVSKVSILGVGGSTHGNSMGQRTIFPAFSCAGGKCTITAPPNAHVCPPGWYQVFALNPAGVPAQAQWVRIGGDPADFGAWPKSTLFKVPGSG